MIRPAVLIAGVALALAVAGCGGGSGSAASSGGSSSPASTASSPATSTTSSAATSTPTTPSNFAFGQTVEITANGIAPKWLVSLVGKRVRWQNHTGHAVKVIFDNYALASSPLIPAGGSWRSKALGMASIAYHVTTHPTLHGAVQVTPASN